jgi:type 1 glutamine amidotransferase
MLKILKYSLVFLLIALIIGGFISYRFINRVLNGVEDYDLVAPNIEFDEQKADILVFTKTNAFRHNGAIQASLPTLQKICQDRNWHMIHTESGAVFNEEYLSQIDLIIWNNTTGPVLTADQQRAMRTYIETGGGFFGIHAAGDRSHKWTWYRNHIIGADYSHHPMNPQFQEAKMSLECDSTHTFLCNGLTPTWNRTDEWYIFNDNPRDNGMSVLYTVDESTINPDGEFLFMQKDKKHGMGDDHPIVWYSEVGEGRAVYSALGHTKESWQEENHLKIIRNAMQWAVQTEVQQ